MSPRPTRARALAAGAIAVLTVLTATATAAHAHERGSSTIEVDVDDAGEVEALVSVAVADIDGALGTDHLTDDDAPVDDVRDYVLEHLIVSGDSGAEWDETATGLTRGTSEGTDFYRIAIDLDPGADDVAGFTLAYDGVIEAVPDHEVVVIAIDPDGEVSSPGILGADEVEVVVGGDVAVGDMAHHGLVHVLGGADHLLFLIVLLLPAPLVAVAGRWRTGGSLRSTALNVVLVATAFTVGHSVTLMASALGWVSTPSGPVEILIAGSVGVGAVHAVRPLVRHGEAIIAAGFGLVHGLAFAGILADLGLEGRTSLVALLAFNLGVELAQLATIAALFPSLYVLSRTRAYPPFRIGCATLALAAAAGWVVERVEVAANPLAGLEEAAIEHPWVVVAGLAVLAALSWAVDARSGTPQPTGGTEAVTPRAGGPSARRAWTPSSS